MANQIVSANILKVAEINFTFSVKFLQIQVLFSLIQIFCPEILLLAQSLSLKIFRESWPELFQKYINHSLYFFRLMCANHNYDISRQFMREFLQIFSANS